MENFSKRREIFHNVLTTTHRADWQATTNDLAKTCQVGLNRVATLSAIRTEAKASDHFVEYQ